MPRTRRQAPGGYVYHVLNRGSPFGADDGQAQTVKELGLESTVRERGRPRLERKEPLGVDQEDDNALV